MKNIQNPAKNKIYIFPFVTISIAATILILSTILNINFERTALSLVYNYIADNLSKISYSTDFMNSSAKSLGLQVYFDSYISRLMYSRPDVTELSTGLKRLNLFRNTTPFIDSIYIYNGRTKMFYTNLVNNEAVPRENFFDTGIISILDDFHNHMPFTPIPRNIPDLYAKYTKKQFINVYTYVIYDSPQSADTLNEAVILNVSEKWMLNTINSLDINPESNTFIIDSKGTVVTDNRKSLMMADMSRESFVKRVLSSKEPSGYFTDVFEGSRSLITYISPAMPGWKYVQVTPYQSLTKKIGKVREATLFIGAIILIIGLISSYAVSRRIYRPIKHILNKLGALEEDKRNQNYTLKQELLRAVLYGELGESRESLLKKFGNLGINLDLDSFFCVVLLKIDKYKDFCTCYNVKDRGLYKSGIMNIASEIFLEGFKNDAVDTGDDNIALVINVKNDDTFGPDAKMYEAAKKIQDTVAQYIPISLSVFISDAGNNVYDIRNLYEQAVHISKYKLFHGYGCILFHNDIDETASNEYVYPLNKEKLLIDDFMLGNIAESKILFTETIENAARYSYTAFQTCMLRLAIAVNTVVDSIRVNNRIFIDYSLNNFLVESGQCETIAEISSLFFKIFEDIAKELERTRSSKHDQLLSTIMNIINKEYASQNISLETISSAVGMSPNYLNRLFKRMTSKSVSDFINETRMEKAKSLLATTDVSVGKISETVGFISSKYFYTLFKKMNGVTPNEYRASIAPLQK